MSVNPGNWSFQSNFFDLLDDYLLGAIQQLRGQEEVEGGGSEGRRVGGSLLFMIWMKIVITKPFRVYS